jgi:hypothetical protein
MHSLATPALILLAISTGLPGPAVTTDDNGGAKLAKPVSWGSPNEPYGTRRAVTTADRAAISAYRNGSRKPVYATTFTDAAELDWHWEMVSDDNRYGDYLSCRRPASVQTTPAGLRIKTLVATDCGHKWSTGYIASRTHYTFGFFEERVMIADITGLDNALWLTTSDNYEIDAAEIYYPSYIHYGLQYWPHNMTEKHTGMGWGAYYTSNLAQGFHDVGLLWTPTEIIYEIDGEPVAAAETHGSVKGAAAVRISSALLSGVGKLPEHPEGHDMQVKSMRIFAYAAQ